MTVACRSPPFAEAYDPAAAVQSGSEGTEESAPLGSKMSDVQFTVSGLSTCDISIDGEDGELTQREQKLLLQLFEARSQILAKEHEVCDLQDQLSQQYAERQRLGRRVIEREKEILRILESSVSSKVRVSDAGQNCNVSESATESRSVSRDRAWQPKEQSPRNNVHSKVQRAATAPSTPRIHGLDMLNRSPQAPLRQHFKFHACETSGSMSVPKWAQSATPRTGAQTATPRKWANFPSVRESNCSHGLLTC